MIIGIALVGTLAVLVRGHMEVTIMARRPANDGNLCGQP